MPARTKLDTYARGRRLITTFINAARREFPTRKPKDDVSSALKLHAFASIRRAEAVRTLHRGESAGSAAALARTVVEIAYSACYLALAPKPRRAHRAARFSAFNALQTRRFMEWKRSLGFEVKNRELHATIEARAQDALRLFRKLEQNLTVGWSGERPSALILDSQSADERFEELRRAYQVLSFFVHPTPFGMLCETRPPDRFIKDVALTLGVPLVTAAAVGITCDAYVTACERPPLSDGIYLREALRIWLYLLRPEPDDGRERPASTVAVATTRA